MKRGVGRKGKALALLGVLACGGWGAALPVVRGAVTQSAAAAAPLNKAPLTKAEVQKFVQLRRAARTALGPGFAEVQKLWVSIQAGETPTLLQVAGVLRKTAGQVGAARKQQQQLLKQKGMTPQRYAAVRAAVNRALGLPSVDLQQIAQALQKGELPDPSKAVRPASAQEKALVAPFATELRASAAVGLLGL